MATTTAAAADAEPEPTDPVLPADPSLPCPIGWLPNDLWYHISSFVASDQSSDFVVSTGQTVCHNSHMPLRALCDDADIVLHGVPANGQLYITAVPEESEDIRQDCESMGLVADDGQPLVMPDDGTVGPWYSKIHRHVGGAIDRHRTPLIDRHDSRHVFYVEGTAPSAVKLHISTHEDDVVKERHDVTDLRPANSRETQRMKTRLVNRMDAIMADENRRFMRVSGASTKACKGKLTVLALCKALKIKAKLNVLGILPLMARLDHTNPVDELSDMTYPYNLKSQMTYSLNKWLMLVPSKWVICKQHNAQRVLSEQQKAQREIPTIEQIRVWNRLHPDRRTALNNPDRFLDRNAVTQPAQHMMALPHGQVPELPMDYANTSFKTLAPLMVYAFFSCANRFVSLTSDAETHMLFERANTSASFREEFSLTGPHVTAAGPSEHLTVSKASAAASAEMSPELELLGGYAGVL